GTDLNGDGDAGDLVLQLLNVRKACATGTAEGACHALAAASVGVCTTDARACATDADCAGGRCFVPPGGCIRDFGTTCDSDPADQFDPCGPGVPCTCAEGQFCQPILGGNGAGTCRAQVQDFCAAAQDCPADTVCQPRGQDVQRLVDPLAKRERGSVFTG